jgi:hypothetical protein
MTTSGPSLKEYRSLYIRQIMCSSDLVVVGVVERLDIEEHRISIVLARLGALGRLLCLFGRKPQVTEKLRYSSGYPLLHILLLQCPVYTNTVHLRWQRNMAPLFIH